MSRQARMRGITIGRRDGFEAMMRAVGQHKLKPMVDWMFRFAALKEAIAYPKSGTRLGKIVIRH